MRTNYHVALSIQEVVKKPLESMVIVSVHRKEFAKILELLVGSQDIVQQTPRGIDRSHHLLVGNALDIV